MTKEFTAEGADMAMRPENSRADHRIPAEGIRLSGTIMEPRRHVVGYGKLNGRGFTWDWNRKTRTRAHICVTEEDLGNLFTRQENQAIRRAIVRLWKGDAP